MTIEQSHKSHTARVPYPSIYNIQNKNAHILVVNGVLCDMGHVHCGIYEIVCSSLVQDQLHIITLQTYTWPVMAMGGCPTNLNRIWQFWFFFSWGRGQGAVRQALRQRHFAGRNGRLTAPSNKICCGETFSVFNRFKPNLVCLLGDRVNDHPPTLTKIGQL